MGMRITGQSSPRKDMPYTIYATAVLADVATFAQKIAERHDYLKQIVQDTIRNGGTTTNLARIEEPGELPPSIGFLVGGVVKSTIVKNAPSKEDTAEGGDVVWEKYEGLAINDLARFIAANAYLLANGPIAQATGRTYYLGTWVDESTGDVHIDVSEYVVNGGDAAELAQERGELAIWDLATGTEKRIA